MNKRDMVLRLPHQHPQPVKKPNEAAGFTAFYLPAISKAGLSGVKHTTLPITLKGDEENLLSMK